MKNSEIYAVFIVFLVYQIEVKAAPFEENFETNTVSPDFEGIQEPFFIVDPPPIEPSVPSLPEEVYVSEFLPEQSLPPIELPPTILPNVDPPDGKKYSTLNTIVR